MRQSKRKRNVTGTKCKRNLLQKDHRLTDPDPADTVTVHCNSGTFGLCVEKKKKPRLKWALRVTDTVSRWQDFYAMRERIVARLRMTIH